MRILLTGAETELGRLLAARLQRDHDLRPLPSDADLLNPERVAPCLEGVRAVAHLASFTRPELSDPGAEREALNLASRGSFVLMHAALAAGVRRVVVASRLDVLSGHGPECVVDETWQPRPEADVASLLPYLSELTVREFVRAEDIQGVCLRLGETPDEAALDALERALVTDLPERGHRWELRHVGRSA